MMITRSIALALICASALALSPIAPLQVVGDNSDCALYLNGPGRSSAYDYSINLLKGNLRYEGQANCITYEAINQAYIEARNRILVSQPKGDWKAEDFASVGELILDISINIARKYGLTYEEIEKGLPLIDTSRTLIREVCPPVFSHVECRAGKYRRLDGLCNNLQHPTWGATMAPFQRLIGPLFADGINAPRIAHHGRDLPLSRVVSRTMHPDDGFHDHAGTVMVIAWGQFMDHDYTLTATPLDPINRNDPEECCKRPPHLKHPYCNEIRIPDDDQFYNLFGVKCIDFVRGFPSPRPGCRLGSRVPYNTLTGAIDGNTVYGVTEKFARKLRTGFGGLLRMNPVFKEYGLKDLLPLKLDIPDEGCTRPNKNMYCFEAGEIRVNEQLVLAVMHTLMAREHNRIANALAEVNPHWDDETLYQESRRINIAEIQHITYNEFLPILLGRDVMEKFGLVLEKEGYWDGYDTEVNPDVLASFAAAAYRFGHSLLPTAVERWSKAHKFIASKRLSDLIRRPYDLYRAGVLDEYIMGLMNQVAQAMDDSITQEVTNHLFKKVGARFGMDLVSFNMQRGREFGLPGYMEFRKFCGLPPAETFQDLFGSMPNQTVQKYETIFDHPIDVDLWSGGVSERPLPGSMLGPTFACIIATQFSYSRRGDRFWFELPNQPSSFTPEQLAEIRKSRLARIICDNTDIIDTVQLYPMVLPDHELNPRVPCRSGILPQMDFSKWAEPAPFHGSAKQFMTEATVFETNSTKHEELADDKYRNEANISEIVSQNPDLTTPQQVQGTNNTIIGSNNDSVSDSDNDTVTDSNNDTITNNNNDTVTESNNDTVTDSNNDTITNNNNDTVIYNGNQTSSQNEEINSNEVKNNTLLKFLSSIGENLDEDNKVKGHFKNSLRRRRRSPDDPLSPLPSKFQKPALIVDYETSHAPSATPNWSPPLQSSTVVKNEGLTDYDNTETQNNTPKKDSSDIENLQEGSYESTERGKHEQNENEENYDSDETKERKDYKNSPKYSTSDQNSAESSESDSLKTDSPYLSKTRNRKDSTEHYGRSKSDFRRRGNKDSPEKNRYNSREGPYNGNRGIKERSRYRKPYKAQETDDSSEQGQENSRVSNSEPRYSNEDSSENRYNKPYTSQYNDHVGQNKEIYQPSRQSSEASIENDDSSESYTPKQKAERVHKKENYRNKNQLTANDNSNEKDSYLSRNNANQRNSDDTNENTSSSIQDIDLGKFSHERIKIDENGKVKSANDNHDNTDPNSAVEVLSPDAIKTKNQKHDVLHLVTNIHKPSQEYADKLIQINDGEVKPVVEINAEQDDDSSEENRKGKSNNSESLETLLDDKEPQNVPGNEKIVAQKVADTGDVKQQFERIPLNYNHAQKTEKTDSKSNESGNENTSKTDIVPKEDTGTTKSEGTLDAFTPSDVRYDENLNIKFDDLQINLPEIKLPKDILAFTKKHSPFYDENGYDENKKSRYHYDQDDEKPRDKTNKKDDNEENDHEDIREDAPAYYGYYGGESEKTQDYKKKNEDDEDDKENEGEEEDEDLYEKFVRERFGRRGTFEKRSEKLEERPLDPNLTKTIQNILKKTADIDEEAKKSGDPNANYMWILEYGENL